MLALDDCYLWQTGDCEWAILDWWRGLSPFRRLDVFVLALMLIYVVAVVIYVSYRCYLARRARGIDGSRRRTLAAVLNFKVGNLKSIAITAPYLGLAGTCVGILSVSGTGKTIAMGTAQALIPTAAAIPVAVLAT